MNKDGGIDGGKEFDALWRRKRERQKGFMAHTILHVIACEQSGRKGWSE